MIDYYSSFVYTNGVVFPDTLAINATGAGTGDGTEIVKIFIDDLWGARQALMDAAGLTPDSVTEAPDTSQLLEAIRKICGSPGEGVIWWKDSDPAITGDRVLLLNGQGILRANYPELDDAVYVGDTANPTASAFYHADDAAGTIRNTTGIYLILPDTRGYVLRGLDTAGSVDPDGASRDLGSIQDFAIENITGNLYHRRYNDTVDDKEFIALVDGVFSESDSSSLASPVIVSSVSIALQKITFDASTVVNTATETRMVNVATKYGIRY